MTTKPQSKTVATCIERQQALPKYAPNGATVHAVAYTLAQLQGAFQKCIDTRALLTNLRGQVTAALAARKQADVDMQTLDAGLKDWVFTTFGPSSQAATDFGYAKKPKAKPTVADKAAAAEKAKETRALRGTKGPKQRKAIKAAGVAATPAAGTASTSPAAATPAPAGGSSAPTKS
jgi:hypothetical protein